MTMNRLGLYAMLAMVALSPVSSRAQPVDEADGARGFDFLIGDWKAHLKQRLKPLTGSNAWVEFDGYSRTHKLLDGPANLEDFHVEGPSGVKHAQTLRLYNPASRQWSIYLVDVNKGTLGLPATVGRFHDGRGEFVDQEVVGGQVIWVRYQWTHASADTAHFEQSFSADQGRSWEVNWICDLTRAATSASASSPAAAH